VTEKMTLEKFCEGEMGCQGGLESGKQSDGDETYIFTVCKQPDVDRENAPRQIGSIGCEGLQLRGTKWLT